MKLSTRSTYGMRALVELALALGHGPVSASHIAKRQDLSVAYLEQLLHRLKRQGLVRSMRGPRGGYVLAREPHQITMAQVVQILDGGNGLAKGSSRKRARGGTANGRGDTKSTKLMAHDVHRHAQWIAQAVRRCVHERLIQSLDEVTLQDLCHEVQEIAGEPLDHRFVFHI